MNEKKRFVILVVLLAATLVLLFALNSAMGQNVIVHP